MSDFLKLVTPSEALEVMIKNLPFGSIEKVMIETSKAGEYILAEEITADENSPAFSRSSVDGYAVKAKDTYGASETQPAFLTLIGKIAMGVETDLVLSELDTVEISTGGMLPLGADAVVMVENTQILRPGEIEILKPVAPGENIIEKGEDIHIGQKLFESGQDLRAQEIGTLIALGCTRIQVRKKPVIGIISSGDEVIPPENQPKVGQVRDINTHSLSALAKKLHCDVVSYGIIPDNQDMLDQTLKKAIRQCDLVVVTAGSSAGIRDLTATGIQKLGAPGVLVHGIHQKPGKPTILGVCHSKPIIGLPGNPTSALIIANVFLPPILEHILGCSRSYLQHKTHARLSGNVASETGRMDYLPVRIKLIGNEKTAEPVYYKSNFIYAITAADGLAIIPASQTGLNAGDWVEILYF